MAGDDPDALYFRTLNHSRKTVQGFHAEPVKLLSLIYCSSEMVNLQIYGVYPARVLILIFNPAHPGISSIGPRGALRYLRGWVQLDPSCWIWSQGRRIRSATLKNFL